MASPDSANPRSWILAAAMATGPSVLGVAAVAILGGVLFGAHTFWDEPELTISEAAALKDRGTILRLIWDGVDPNRPARVRAGILKDDELVLTPLEASVGTRTAATMQLLLAHGVRMDAHERDVIVCLAIKEGAREILEFLEQEDSQEQPDCERVATPW